MFGDDFHNILGNNFSRFTNSFCREKGQEYHQTKNSAFHILLLIGKNITLRSKGLAKYNLKKSRSLFMMLVILKEILAVYDGLISDLSEVMADGAEFKQKKRAKWKKFWKEKRGIKGYFNVQPHAVEITPCPNF